MSAAPRSAPPLLPLTGTLDALSPHVCRDLVADEAWQGLRAVSAQLPAAVASGIYLECRLAPGAGHVDLILRVEREGAGIVAGRNPAIALPSRVAAEPAWRKVADLCAWWLGSDTVAAHSVDHLWLEFDVGSPGGGADEVPRPSVFVGLRPELQDDADSTLRLIDEVGEILLPAATAAGTRQILRGIASARPAGARVPYVGFMIARPGAAGRVYLAGTAEDDLPDLLRRVCWPGDPASVVAGLSRPGGGRSRPSMVHLDAAGEILPGLGVEHALRRAPQLRGEIAETGLLQGLVEDGLCAAAKRNALLGWPGSDLCTLPHELWPTRLLRRVNCVKLLYHGRERRPEAKGYLLAWPTPSPSSRGRPSRPASNR